MESSRGIRALSFLSLLPVALFLFTVAPLSVAAQRTADLSAGFAPNSIWASRRHIRAGNSIALYTALYNSSDTPFSGDAVFMVDGKPVGTRHFSIKAGETEIASVPWNAVAGKHSLSARIEKPSNADTKQDATILNKITDTITIDVVEPPPPPPPLPPSPAAQAVSSVASALGSGFSAAAPVVAGAVEKVYEATEALRKNTAAAIGKQLAQSPNNPDTAASYSRQRETTENKNAKAVATDATASTSSDTPLLPKIWKTFLQGSLFVLNIAALFYIVLALVIFVVIRVFLYALRDRRPY